MSGRIFQNIVLQFKETTDTVIGVIDSEGTVIACTDLPEIGQRWPHLVQPINEAEGACTALEGKTFKALEGWGRSVRLCGLHPRRGRAQLRPSAAWRPSRSTPPRAITRKSTDKTSFVKMHPLR